MENNIIIWNSTSPESVINTGAWEHVLLLSKCASFIKNMNLKSQQVSFSYQIEVTLMKHISLEGEGNIWVKLIVFLKDYPNQTYTLLTLYCNKDLVFPVRIGLNYYYDNEDTYCFNKVELQSTLIEASKKNFRIMSESVNKYYEYKDWYPLIERSNIVTLVSMREGTDQNQIKEKKSPRLWSNEENEIFLDIMTEYRKQIQKQEDNDVKFITRKFSVYLKENYEKLSHRSEQAIYEHLSYFDDLLAGAGHIQDYALKDYQFYKRLLRPNGETRNNPARVWRKKRFK